MTGHRKVMVIAATAPEAERVVREYDWGNDTKVIWAGAGMAHVCLGDIRATDCLYEVTVVFEWAD